MVNKANWFSKNTSGKHQINSTSIYQALYPEIIKQVNQNIPISIIVKWLRDETTKAYQSEVGSKPTTGSLNNSVGRWNEFITMGLLSEIALEISQKDNICLTVFAIENSRVQYSDRNLLSANFLNLFRESEFNLQQDLNIIQDVKERIFFPSPDIVVALIDGEDKLVGNALRLLKKQILEPTNMELYDFLKGQLKARDVLAVISLKTSNRPDRRYQPSFEAAMIKAVAYAANIGWKYYMVASELTEADKFLFKTAIPPHSIAVQEKDTKLVDRLIEYIQKRDLEKLIEDIVSKI